ncbi:MAG: LacI family DNA-binding transcriptional regulator [Candidatus Gallimonas sp.]
MKKAVTIKSIAEQLNLSRNTVAKALNGHYVPEKTRELVLNKARELNYKSINAEQGASPSYRILLVSGKPLNNINYFVPIIRGIENSCYAKNYELFQYTYHRDRTPFSDFANYVKEINVSGIVAIECFNKDFNTRLVNFGKPVCFIDFTAQDAAAGAFDVIAVNDFRSVYDLVLRLRKRYRISRFCFVGDPEHCMSFRERYHGMLTALAAQGCPHAAADDVLCSDETFDYGNPAALSTEILKLVNRPECFICCNDFVARAVCNALKPLGVAVPDDVLVVGFDNVAETVASRPTLTTFSVNKEFLGSETVRTLVHRIENPAAPARMIIVGAKPVPRESTAR